MRKWKLQPFCAPAPPEVIIEKWGNVAHCNCRHLGLGDCVCGAKGNLKGRENLRLKDNNNVWLAPILGMQKEIKILLFELNEMVNFFKKYQIPKLTIKIIYAKFPIDKVNKKDLSHHLQTFSCFSFLSQKKTHGKKNLDWSFTTP